MIEEMVPICKVCIIKYIDLKTDDNLKIGLYSIVRVQLNEKDLANFAKRFKFIPV